jgi:hypothetical protein
MDKDAEIEADLEAVPETRPEEEFMGEKSKEAQMNQKILEVKFTEGQEPEPMGGTQTPNEQPEEGQGGQHKLGRNLGLCKEEAESRVEAHLRLVAETLENQKRRDVESRNAQEEKAGTEGTEEAAAGDQALEAKAEGGQESELSEVLGCGAEEGQASVSENQELEGHQGAEAEAGPGQSLEESEAGESKFSEMETAVPWETDRVSRGGCKLEEAVLSLQDSKDPQTSSLSAEIVKEALPHRAAGAGEGPDQEAGVAWEGAFERSWDSEGREEAVEIENQGGQEVGSVGSAEEEATDHSSQAEASEARKEEQAEVGGSTMTERSNERDGVTSVSQGARTERDTAMVEAEGLLGEQMVLEEETEGEQVREQRKGSKDHHEKEETQRLLDAEDIMTRGQMPEAQQAGPGLKDIQGQEEQPAHQVPAEAGLGSSETAEPLESTRGDTDSCWSEVRAWAGSREVQEEPGSQLHSPLYPLLCRHCSPDPAWTSLSHGAACSSHEVHHSDARGPLSVGPLPLSSRRTLPAPNLRRGCWPLNRDLCSQRKPQSTAPQGLKGPQYQPDEGRWAMGRQEGTSLHWGGKEAADPWTSAH